MKILNLLKRKHLTLQQVYKGRGLSGIVQEVYNKIYFVTKKYKTLLLKKIYPVDPQSRYVNIGGGNWYFLRWENVDYYADDAFIDCKHDLRLMKPIPLQDSCAKAIFTSHVLEHISDENCLFVLRECHRILKNEGLLRIAVPDMDKAFHAYFKNNERFFDEGCANVVGDSIERKLVNYFASYSKNGYRGGPIINPDVVRDKVKTLEKYEFVKWCASLIPQDAPYKAHVNGYDFKKLKTLIKAAGFLNIKRSKYQKSSLIILRNKAFDNRPLVSLFIEAFK